MAASESDPEPSGQALPAGTRIEEFVVECVLGSGGFGITYLARDVRLDRQVVIKENLPVQFCYRDTHSLTVAPRHTTGEDAENFKWSLENFSKEAAMLASLDHPGIVKVLRSFEAFGTAYFVMPFVEGLTLEELAKARQGKPFMEEELRGLLERVLRALGYLHDRGIYHRDIKPGNILITHEGIPILIDFGSARQRLSERSMTVVESAGYTPFEQLQSRGNVGPWSDLYALGATLVKTMTGDPPPKTNDRSFGDPWQPLAGRAELVGRFSEGFLSGIDHSLILPVTERWQEAGKWLAALRGDTSGVTPSSVPLTMDSQSTPSKIHRGKVTPLPWITAACVILGLSVWAMISSNRKQELQNAVAGDKFTIRPEGDKQGIVAVPAPMPKVVGLGSLMLTSEPSGAAVKDMKGRGVGETPTEVKDLEGGKVWQGNVELSGYKPALVEAEVVAGEKWNVPIIKLQPLPQKVIVTSLPAGADVWVSGTLAGKTPYERESEIPGTIKNYTIKKEGYEDGDVEGTVEIGKALELKLVLKPLDPTTNPFPPPTVTPVPPVSNDSPRILYPWKTRVTCTIFWIGEMPTKHNPTPKGKSSWDPDWASSFGGYDDPEPSNRIANHVTGEFRPKNFIPKLNPFYIALPYNDVIGHAAHKPEASRVIPWFSRVNPEAGKTVCKGRWVQIYNGSRSCYAQWEDCGPWVTDDWEYVFGSQPPKTTQNGAAGIDLSPAIRDYLGLKSGQKVHWRFIEAGQVPYGPWKKYGQDPAVAAEPDLAAQQKYLEYLRKLRDEQFPREPGELSVKLVPDGTAKSLEGPVASSDDLVKKGSNGKATEGWHIVKIGDVEYVNIDSIQRFYVFEKRYWEDNDLILENSRVEVRFRIGSNSCVMNDVRFWLFNKILSQDQMVLVSKADLGMILDPVLRPNFVKGAKEFRTVILDPMLGAGSNGEYQPHAKGGEAALKVAQRAKLELEAKGYKVVLTREDSASVSSDKRVKVANAINETAIMIMIGFAAGTQEERGIRTFACDPTMAEATKSQIDSYLPSLCLAASIHGSALRRLGKNTMDGGVSRIQDSFMSRVTHPVILLEGGFVTNSHEAQLIDNEVYQGALAASIVDAVAKYRFAMSRAGASPEVVPSR